MYRITLAALLAAASAGVAHAAPEYDSSIDRAAAAIVAEKLGDLRGGFAIGEKPRMTSAVDSASTGSLAPGSTPPAVEVHGWVDGLAPAADPGSSLPDEI